MNGEAAFLCLLFPGIITLVAGMGLTRWHWRKDIPPYGLRTSALDVMWHPDRYAQGAPFGVIRVLYLAGAVLLACAVALVVRDIVRAISSG